MVVWGTINCLSYNERYHSLRLQAEYTSIVKMSDPEIQRLLGDDTDQANETPEGRSENATNAKVDEVFAMFKTYLEERIDEKGKQIELKGKTEKEVVQLNYKGNQKQYELNAKIDSILEEIEKSNSRDGQNSRISTLVKEAKSLIKRRQKLIKIADRNKDGWKIVEEYESDDLASDSEDEKRLKRAKEAVSKKRRQNSYQSADRNKRQKFNSESEQRFFRGMYLSIKIFTISVLILC